MVKPGALAQVLANENLVCLGCALAGEQATARICRGPREEARSSPNDESGLLGQQFQKRRQAAPP